MNEPTKRKHTDDFAARCERCQQIGRAARTLIVEKGFEGLRTRDIADRVGINIATLHYHISDKEALITLVTQSMRAEFIAQHMSHPQGDLSPLERFQLEFTDFRDTIETNSELHLVFSELISRSRRDAAIREAITPMLKKWRSIFAGILADGQREGVFRIDMDPDAAAGMIIGALMNYGLTSEATAEAIVGLEAEIYRSITNPQL